MRKLHFFSTLVALVFATLQLGAVPTGALSGVFTVDACGRKVYFSQGNLQYKASTHTWRFATNQWDYVGDASRGNVYENSVKCNNANISYSYTGWIDLFGWGTKSNPTNTSTDDANYTWQEWGANAISNGGNTANSGWRTMTIDEWRYILYSRPTASQRYIIATVNGVNGLILFPDEWSTIISNNITIDADTWRDEYEAKGVVMLPRGAGYRHGTGMNVAGASSLYWSSTPVGNRAYDIIISSGGLSSNASDGFHYGQSVRLVQYLPNDLQPLTPASATAPTAASNWTYDGSEYNLLTAAASGVTSGGTVKYRLGTSGEWKNAYNDASLKATNAGTYTVQWYVAYTGSGCYKDSEKSSIVVTVAQADLPGVTLPSSTSTIDYDGTEKTLLEIDPVAGATIYYSTDGGANWTTTRPKATDAAVYNVEYKIVPDDPNYKTYGPNTVTVTIKDYPTVADNADPSTVLVELNNGGSPAPTNLKVKRTIYRNGEYNTICLPFALDATQLAASPLAGFNNLKTIKGASISGTAPDLSIDIFVEDVTAMEAGKPYLISYPSANENIVNPVFTGITVSTTEPGNVEADGVTFRGMFAQVHIDPYTNERDEDYLFLGANSQLMWPNNDGSYMRGFRAYFIIDRNAIPAQVAPRGTHARFVNAPKQPTSIENTELNTQAQKLLENGQLIILKNGIKYNAQGQVLK